MLRLAQSMHFELNHIEIVIKKLHRAFHSFRASLYIIFRARGASLYNVGLTGASNSDVGADVSAY